MFAGNTIVVAFLLQFQMDVHSGLSMERACYEQVIQSWNLQVYLLQVLHLFLSSFTLLLTGGPSITPNGGSSINVIK